MPLQRILPCPYRDEVVHGKSWSIRCQGLLAKICLTSGPLFSYIFYHRIQAAFMGGEIAQFHEWKFEGSIDWHLLNDASHLGMQHVVKDLNQLYRSEKALHECQLPEPWIWMDRLQWCWLLHHVLCAQSIQPFGIFDHMQFYSVQEQDIRLVALNVVVVRSLQFW